nr:uncharacterized protein LOC128702916 isoform X1 [Cherax quadricarinatus]
MKGQIMIDMLLNKFFFLLSFVTSLTVIILIHPGASAMGRLYLQLSKVDTLIPYEAGEAPGKENQIGWYLRHQGMLLLAIMALLNMSGILIMLQSKVMKNPVSVVFLINAVFNASIKSLMLSFPLLHATGLCYSLSALYVRINAWLRCLSFKHSLKALHNIPAHLHRCDPFNVPTNVQRCDHFNVPTNVQRCDPFNIPTNVQRCDPFSVPINVQRYDPFSVPTNVQRCKPFIVVSRIKVYPEEDEVDVLQVANLLLFSLGLLLAVYLLSAAVDYLRVQHERTSELVHRFRTDSGKVCTAWLSSVQLFSLQLLHSSPQFRVAGFFSIDRSFLLAMIGNLATYLVILLQFRDTNSANCSTATKDANRTIV